MAPDHDDRPGGHYFDRDPSVGSDPVPVSVELPDTSFSMWTDRGVFSRGHLDAGTELLLRAQLPLARSGSVLDLGCGAGPIALTMAHRSPHATVWAVDVNERARELTARNAADNGVTNVVVRHPDEVSSDVAFATIWSNPPIRIGKPALRELLATWLARMTPDGSAALVVQKHLGADSLQRWLTDEGFPAERVASKSGFRLLAVGRHDPDR